ncbi:MAG: hypothetical protein ACK5NG_09685 [Chthoniobacterales bacterium]
MKTFLLTVLIPPTLNLPGLANNNPITKMQSLANMSFESKSLKAIANEYRNFSSNVQLS